MKNYHFLLMSFLLLLLIIASVGVFNFTNVRKPEDPNPPQKTKITNFEECAAAGYPVAESYPPQCRANGQIFTAHITQEDKSDLIVVSNPSANELIESPLEIIGQARGFWYFEASFPLLLTDADGNEIARGIATAQDEWMTEDFVPFTATLTFDKPDTATGELILEKDNPSGLPENADSLKIPVNFE